MTIKKFLKYLGWFLLCTLAGVLPYFLGGWYFTDWQWWVIAIPINVVAYTIIKE